MSSLVSSEAFEAIHHLFVLMHSAVSCMCGESAGVVLLSGFEKTKGILHLERWAGLLL